ncbi:ABC transporter permease [Roseospira goensis]|uniref:Putative ABC transport system permease protein n=1 Tax=Roseospira goensis TaxID=391922 RepID=A0A7W6RZ83_9PROT|nr:ABC transporter permease [Roseospira goensis]MBB4285966.1 putative ABC transport system permease protein [Roseospira goensis]
MRPLDRKLLRDLWRIKGQAIAIGAVIAVGVLLLVMMTGLVTSLDETRRTYYERYRLADVFAPLTRAPDRVMTELAAIPGVAAAEGRVAGGALIDLPGADLPLQAQAVSLPDFGAPRVNDVYLTDGRRLDPDRADEILLLTSFARAQGLRPGDTLSATMKGARRTFRVVGLAQSPEFLYTTPPGELAPDDARFGVIWMSRTALAAAYDMEGAFNEALLSLGPRANAAAVRAAVDRLLAPYGGQGAYGLEDHVSNRFVSEEIAGLRTTTTVVPPIFLAVAAFLLTIVISRMVQAEREQIGLLKAFGYSNLAVTVHYFKMILAIATAGALAGCLLGVAAGRSMVEFYLTFFKFPFLVFQTDPAAFVLGVLVSVLAASAGGLVVLRGVFALTPATAMRPPTPPNYARAGRIAAGLGAWLDQPSRMVLRRITRQPGRMAGAVVGIAAGLALCAGLLSILDSFNRVMDITFDLADRSDVTVTFVEAQGDKTILELQRLPGVIAVEPMRVVPAVLRHGLNTYRGAVHGLVGAPRLNRALDQDSRPIRLREEGVILAVALADILEIAPGDALTVDVREGRQPLLDLPVIGIAETLVGAPAYMEIGALNRALREPHRVSGAVLRIDTASGPAIYRTLKDMPAVAGVSLKAQARDAVQSLIDSGAGAQRFVMAGLAFVITFGVVYNAARIAQAERTRDIASLRVLGFTRGEAAFVLLGELAVVTLAALPLGLALGALLATGLAEGFSTDLYQIPALYSARACGVAVLAVLTAALASGWLVKRDLDRVDLVSALKTRE